MQQVYLCQVPKCISQDLRLFLVNSCILMHKHILINMTGLINQVLMKTHYLNRTRLLDFDYWSVPIQDVWTPPPIYPPPSLQNSTKLHLAIHTLVLALVQYNYHREGQVRSSEGPKACHQASTLEYVLNNFIRKWKKIMRSRKVTCFYTLFFL